VGILELVLDFEIDIDIGRSIGSQLLAFEI
jgi:hypothetical protein